MPESNAVTVSNPFFTKKTAELINITDSMDDILKGFKNDFKPELVTEWEQLIAKQCVLAADLIQLGVDYKVRNKDAILYLYEEDGSERNVPISLEKLRQYLSEDDFNIAFSEYISDEEPEVEPSTEEVSDISKENTDNEVKGGKEMYLPNSERVENFTTDPVSTMLSYIIAPFAKMAYDNAIEKPEAEKSRPNSSDVIASLAEIQKEYVLLEQERNNAVEKSEELQKTCDILKESLSSIEVTTKMDIEQIKQENASLKSDNDEWEIICTEKEEEAKASKEKADTAEEQNRKLSLSVEELTKSLKDSTSSVEELKRSLKDAEGRLKSKENDINQLRNNLNNKNEEIRTIKENSEKNLSDLRRTLKEGNEKSLSDLRRTLEEEKKNAIDNAVKEVKETEKKNTENAVREKGNQIKNLENQVSSLKEQLNSQKEIKGQLDKVAEERNSLRTSDEQKSKEINNLKNKINDLEQEINNKKPDAKQEEMIKALKDEVEELKKLAYTDAKTGVLNVNAFNRDFAKAVSKNTALALVDICNMKGINSTYGRETGNDTVYAVSDALVNAFSADKLYRVMGGDQFMLIDDIKNARHVHSRLSSVKETLMNENNINITFSVVTGDEHPSSEALFNAAFDMLNDAKVTGKPQKIRNNVETKTENADNASTGQPSVSENGLEDITSQMLSAYFTS